MTVRQAPDRAAVWARRLRLVAAAVTGEPVEAADTTTPRLRRGDLASALSVTVDRTDLAQVWLSIAVLSGTLPLEEDVVEVARRGTLDDGSALADAVARATTPRSLHRTVRVTASDEVLVDVAGTLPLTYTTGIQRVVRSTVPRWKHTFGATPVTWTGSFDALRDLTDAEHHSLDPNGTPSVTDDSKDREQRTVVVPWRSTFLAPEVLFEPDRSIRAAALARFARCRTAAIAYDLVPLTVSETRADVMGDSWFVRHLGALAHFDQLATISAATSLEYAGWRSGLAATGRPGPAIDVVTLPDEVVPESASSREDAHGLLTLSGFPMVLVVGTREPRKNHAAVAHAAEILWRAGHQFDLVFIGGRSWASQGLDAQIRRLQDEGRPLAVHARASDALLAAAYRLARFTVFPSLHEGFGLPVAESLAYGTPVITSAFGSMQEIADGGGALTVDPRDDHAIAAAMERLLSDDELYDQLRAQARARVTRTWDQYAAESWQVLTGREPT